MTVEQIYLWQFFPKSIECQEQNPLSRFAGVFSTFITLEGILLISFKNDLAKNTGKIIYRRGTTSGKYETLFYWSNNNELHIQ